MKKDIRDRIASLIAKAMDSAATASEAETAMALAKKLMKKHGVDESDLKNGEETISVTEFAARHHEKFGMIFHPVDRHLGRLIAEFTGCRKYVRRTSETEACSMYVGLPSDRQFAEYLRTALIAHYNSKWEDYKLIERKNKSTYVLTTAKQSFTHGFVTAIRSRLEDWIFRVPMDEEAKTEHALVTSKHTAVDAWVQEHFGTPQTKVFTGKRTPVDTQAAAFGLLAGNSAAIGQGVHYGRQPIGITARKR